jgi:hypothetical protein
MIFFLLLAVFAFVGDHIPDSVTTTGAAPIAEFTSLSVPAKSTVIIKLILTLGSNNTEALVITELITIIRNLSSNQITSH